MRRVLLSILLASCSILFTSSVDAFSSSFALQQRSKISTTVVKAQDDDITSAAIPSTDIASADSPSVDIPSVDIPSVDMPSVDIPSVDIPSVVKTAIPNFSETADDAAKLFTPEKQFKSLLPLNNGRIYDKLGDDPTPPPSPPIIDLTTTALVAGQENYGLAIVLLIEAVWSFSKSPSIDHGLKTLLPAIVSGVVLGAVSGPMITSGEPASVQTGLFIATGVSVAMGVVYAARLSAPFSPAPKEIPAGGLVVAFAGFVSFSQNLVVEGFVKLPTLPSLPGLPTFGDIHLPNLPF
jgi:hypothetical protein